MNIFLWILQIFFGVVFLVHGLLAIFQPSAARSQLEKLPFSKAFLQFIGVCEVLGGLGLVLPWWLGVMPMLTPIAALGLVIILMGAASSHFRRKETSPAIITSLFSILLVVVVIARW